MENDCVLEIRYKPNPKILDVRGQIASNVSSTMNLNKWNVHFERIDFDNDDQDMHSIVSFKNIIFTIKNCESSNYFRDQSVKFLRSVLQIPAFTDSNHIVRIGVRHRFYFPYSDSFENLFNLFLEKYWNISPDLHEVLGHKLIDVNGAFTLSTPNGKVNFNCGPMTSDQVKEFLPHLKSPSEVGLFVDSDYWVAPEKPMEIRPIINTVKNFCNENWPRVTDVKNYILGE